MSDIALRSLTIYLILSSTQELHRHKTMPLLVLLQLLLHISMPPHFNNGGILGKQLWFSTYWLQESFQGATTLDDLKNMLWTRNKIIMRMKLFSHRLCMRKKYMMSIDDHEMSENSCRFQLGLGIHENSKHAKKKEVNHTVVSATDSPVIQCI